MIVKVSVAKFELPKITAAGAPPILVVGTTRDPATPYRWAQALARRVPPLRNAYLLRRRPAIGPLAAVIDEWLADLDMPPK